jgi:hypothetical protein
LAIMYGSAHAQNWIMACCSAALPLSCLYSQISSRRVSRTIDDPVAWLLTAAHNRAIDRLRWPGSGRKKIAQFAGQPLGPSG